ncbi:MAG: hypothetical protein ACHQ4H_04150 [Ktedonobacterales bacterium]
MEPHSTIPNDVDTGARQLRIATACGIALLATVALVVLARELAVTRGPLVAALIVALLLAATTMFALALLEPRPGPSREAAEFDGVVGLLYPQEGVPLLPMAYFPGAPRARRPVSMPAARAAAQRPTSIRRSSHTGRSGCPASRRVGHPRRTLRIR